MRPHRTSLRTFSAVRFLVAAVVALAGAHVCAQAAPDNARFVADLMVKAQFEQSLQVTRKQMPQLMAQLTKQASVIAGSDARAAERNKTMEQTMERMGPLQDRLYERMAEEMARPEIRSQLSDAVMASLKRVYSPAEIDSMADYYRTPVGASVFAKQADLMGDMLPATTKITMQVMQPAMAEFVESMKKMRAETDPPKAK